MYVVQYGSRGDAVLLCGGGATSGGQRRNRYNTQSHEQLNEAPGPITARKVRSEAGPGQVEEEQSEVDAEQSGEQSRSVAMACQYVYTWGG